MINELPILRRRRYAKPRKDEKKEPTLELPVKPGDPVYYLSGAIEPVVETGKIVGFDFRDGHIRVVADFGYMEVSILTELLGTRLFLNEEDAQKELAKWRQS